ncbi:hypothetical protein [Gilvimarinus xylanilyticus]|uniref:Uncharacterized protein n=1 Tax=Gilvimarinus xylanilyticus TaxID=2944139 RepID=A0A9X2KSW6_9GAMM|nr:hypothetical protein [Gilvimarinus xylanilyticus]MCP8899261.1 hypothetical protein [Gilvimarinus xylanilyticus]
MSHYTLKELLAFPIAQTESELESLFGDELFEQYEYYREITDLIDHLRCTEYSRQRDADIEKLQKKIALFDSLAEHLFTGVASEDHSAPRNLIARRKKKVDLSSDHAIEKVYAIADHIAAIPGALTLPQFKNQKSLTTAAQYITEASVILTKKAASNPHGRAETLINLYNKHFPDSEDGRMVFRSRRLAAYLQELFYLQKN